MIRLLRIERFRGIERLEWRPAPGLNVIVGPGDTCKSTILEAIGALLSPAPNMNISEFDYFRREIDKGFEIEAALTVGDGSILKSDRFPLPPLRGWCEGQLTDLPDEGGAEAVMLCRLTGTPDQEAVYEVVGADETRVPLWRALRQRIGLMRLGIADRSDRDLRLVQGGALDRYMEGHELRQSILQAILNTPIHDRLGEKPKDALARIDERFGKRSLPRPVRLGLVGTPGVSLAASVGLMIGQDDESALPLPAWGTGTRRLATLELASILVESSSLAVVDEPESGLEPYRQRAFIGDLHRGGKRQAFITTHAPAILSAGVALGAVISRINIAAPTPMDDAIRAVAGEQAPLARAPQTHALTALEGNEIAQLLKRNPEAVLARLPVICEGITEEGFASRLLIARFGEAFSVHGIFCVDGGGHDRALAICKALLKAGFQIAVVADDEGRRDGSWGEIGKRASLLRWENGAALEHALLGALPDEVLPLVVSWPEEFGGRQARHCLPELRAALGTEKKDRTAEQLLKEYGREAFVKALCSAACPPRDGSRKPAGWFKSFEGGFLLADKLLSLAAVPKELNDKIAEFLQAIDQVKAA
jgi:putative ATP-dependent endonuclease of the OLD family